MNSGISDSDSGQNTKMAGLSQNQCPVYRGMTVRVMPESVSGLLRNMQLAGILPEMNDDEAQQTAALHSIGGLNPGKVNWRLRPFRSPHHSASSVALVGGGCHLHK